MQANGPEAQSYRVLTDADVERWLTMGVAVRTMEQTFLDLARRTLVAPPRFSLDSPGGSLVFTAGASTGSAHSMGFRVYDTFASRGCGPPAAACRGIRFARRHVRRARDRQPHRRVSYRRYWRGGD